MKLEELYTLMERFSSSDLSELLWQQEGEAVRLKKDQAAAGCSALPQHQPAQTAQPMPEEGALVTAPLVGTFYAAPAPGKPAFAPVGKRVKKGESLCLIEAMKMLSEVPSPFDGTILQVLAQDGEPVGHGAPLFRIRKE